MTPTVPHDPSLPCFPPGTTVGLIAGQGRLPVLTAQGMQAAGLKVACVGLAGQYDPDLPQFCDQFAQAGIIRLGRWIKLLRGWHVQHAVMIGRVRKARMFEPLRLIRQLPDLRAAKLWYRVLRHDRRNATLLGAVADELARSGVTLMDSTTYLPQCLAQPGILTQTQPSPNHLADIQFGWPLVAQLAQADIGQALAVMEREVIAVEAIEGTDAMIQRAGQLCRVKGWTLLKTAAARQDMRFDVPTVGPRTIEKLHASGGTCLVVQAGKVLLADRDDMLSLADRYRIVIIGK